MTVDENKTPQPTNMPWFRITYDVGLGINYSWLIQLADGRFVAVDPGVTEPFTDTITTHGIELAAIVLTHKHKDHIGGSDQLASIHNVPVYAPSEVTSKVTHRVKGGDLLVIGDSTIQVIDTGGHTLGHVSFYIPEQQMVITGDALFAMGCGRMMEGYADMMWQGLKRLKALSDDTMVFCGHEYSEANAHFALSLSPQNPRVIARARRIKTARCHDEATVPYRLGDDKITNPFLLYDKQQLATAVGLAPDTPDDQVFAALRYMKDQF